MAIKWKIDPAHSEVQFRVKHLMITTVTGYFKKFDLEVVTESEDFNSTKEVVFTADIDSIDTNSAQRDVHLKSADFFDGEKYKQLRFVGTSYKAKEDEANLSGDLTIRDITKPVVLKIEFGGIAVDPYGQTKAGFTVKGRISRKEFGLTWNAVTEAGHIVVGDEIRIHCEIQLIKQLEQEDLAMKEEEATVNHDLS
jgi:polyisoprenoid-binding protein YceI